MTCRVPRQRPLIRFHGHGKEWNQQLLAIIQAILVERRHHFNLRKLHGVTVGFGLDDVLRATEQKWGISTHFLPPTTKRSRRVAAGCAVGLMRQERYVSHVFLDATHLADLVDDPRKESYAANIIVHEFAHVALNHWQTKPPLDYLLPIGDRDWRYEILRFLTLDFWDEYVHNAHIGSLTPAFRKSV
jgi:hypothetical protein